MGQMICLAGMPGVGKTTWAKKFCESHPEFLYFSPDEYYGRINGDECNRDHTFEIWMSMFRDIHTAEIAGHDVIIDSDNLTYAQRCQWIEWFPNFEEHILFYMEEDFNTCFARVNERKRTIPEDVMRQKWYKWENPWDSLDTHEWDAIYLAKTEEKDGSIYVEM